MVIVQDLNVKQAIFNKISHVKNVIINAYLVKMKLNAPNAEEKIDYKRIVLAIKVIMMIFYLMIAKNALAMNAFQKIPV